MSKKPWSPLLLIACLLAGVGVSGWAEEVPSTPKELNELAVQFLETKKREIDEPIATRRAQVDKNYLNALSQASQKASTGGDLETVLELRKETERIQKGEPFPGVAAYRQHQARELVKTYGEFLAQTDSDRSSRINGLAAKFDTSLRALITDLTKQGRVDDALAVKVFREGPDLQKLVQSGSAPGAEAAMASSVTAEAPGAGPSAIDPTTTTAATPGRLVIVPLEAGGAQHPASESVATADLADLIHVGPSNFPVIGAVRADGSLVFWKGDASAPEIVPGKATLCVADHLIPLVGLNADGTLVSATTDDSELAARIQAESGVSHIVASSGVLAVVHSDGLLTMLGPRATVPTPSVMSGMKDVSQVGFSGAAFASVLKSDGTVIDIANGAPKEQTRARGLVKIHSHVLGENKSGEVVSWGAPTEEVTKSLGRNPRYAFFQGRRFCGIRADHSVYLARMGDTGNWLELDDLAEALEGAQSMTWLTNEGSEWIAAVLPAASVPRSGFWELGDLTAARKSGR